MKQIARFREYEVAKREQDYRSEGCVRSSGGGGTTRSFQELSDHAIISQEEYTTKGGDVAGEIDDKINPKTAKI